MTGAAAGLCLQPTLNPSCRTNYAEFLPDGIKFMIATGVDPQGPKVRGPRTDSAEMDRAILS